MHKKSAKKIYSIKGTLIPPSPIHVVPGKVEFTPQEDTYYKEILCNVCEEPVRAYTQTDYACPKCHPEKFNRGNKDKFYRRFLTHEEQMVGAELFQKAFVGFQKEEPKPECDHIVGIAYQGALGFAQKASDPIKNYIQKFNYCPDCGEKLNLKKDE